MLTDETAKSAYAFVLAALRYYKSLGVKIEQVMTDNGAAYKSRRFAKLLRRLGIRHIRTRLGFEGNNVVRNNSYGSIWCITRRHPQL